MPAALALLAAAALPDPRRWWMAGALVVVATLAAAGAVAALLADRDRQAVLARLAQAGPTERRRGRRRHASTADLLRPTGATGRWARLVDWLDEWIPDALTPAAAAQRLVQAGYDDPAAPILLGALRLAAPLLLAALLPPLVGELLGRGAALALGAATGVVLPAALLDRLVARRRTALLRAIPDALDLLVVCLEAGVSLDGALLRVARDLGATHPAMAEELTGVTRRVSAGLPRDEALRGLHARTGLDELRALAAVMIQADRWGTSLARVLRIHADALRGDRRQRAERVAQEASVKMIFPIVIFLLPAFFAIVLGPAVLQIAESLR